MSVQPHKQNERPARRTVHPSCLPKLSYRMSLVDTGPLSRSPHSHKTAVRSPRTVHPSCFPKILAFTNSAQGADIFTDRLSGQNH